MVFASRISKLGILEYALKLCMLQVLEEKDHWLLSDERIKMFFADPRFVCEPVANTQRPQSDYKHESSASSSTPKKSTLGQSSLSRTLIGSVPVSSRLSVRKLSVADMLFDLKLESGSSTKP
ncbi:hypothetical protein O6H91_Y425200 [Diphasiastrum complanatum]|nr:hypothetical protein O6H91_Y425200 [Diphasiastrum complanatum]